jgi:hypothetical protein
VAFYEAYWQTQGGGSLAGATCLDSATQREHSCDTPLALKGGGFSERYTGSRSELQTVFIVWPVSRHLSVLRVLPKESPVHYACERDRLTWPWPDTDS